MAKLIIGIILSFIISTVCVTVLILVAALLQASLLPKEFDLRIWTMLSRQPKAGYTPFIFSSVFTGTASYIVLKAIRLEQRIRLKDLLGIFKSFLLLTAAAIILYNIIFYMVIHRISHNDLFMVIFSYFSLVILPIMWILQGIYWTRVYTAKFQNNSL